MAEYTLAVNTDTNELARLIAESGHIAALDFVQALDAELGCWEFTEDIRDWAKAEVKEAKRLGYYS